MKRRRYGRTSASRQLTDFNLEIPSNMDVGERTLYEHPRNVVYACQTCGKTYAAPHHLAGHERSCDSNKRSIDSILQESKAFWELRKKRRLEKRSAQSEVPPEALVEDNMEGSGNSALDTSTTEVANIEANPVTETENTLETASPPVDLNVPVAQRKGRREIKLPKRFRQDDLPATPSPVHQPEISSQGQHKGKTKKGEGPPPAPGSGPSQENHAKVTLILHRSVRNTFGVVRAYSFPPGSSLSHDPDQTVTLQDLSDIPGPWGRSIEPASELDQGAVTASQPNSDDVPNAQENAEPNVKPALRQDQDAVTASQPNSGDVPNTQENAEPNAEPALGQDQAAAAVTLQGSSDVPKIPQGEVVPTYGPFKSRTAFSLADWYWNSTHKSFQDFQKLIAVIKQPDFSIDDTINVNWRTAFKTLGANHDDLDDSADTAWITDDGWTSTTIYIDVPFHNKMKDKGTRRYEVGEFRHRRILSVIKEKISNREDSRHFHYHPHRATWKPTEDSPEVELYGELYASQAFRDAHEELQQLQPTESNRGLERVVVALMVWSDATHLTAFGTACLWPCYLFFGNESKYRRSRPTERLANQIAYFRKLSDEFRDYLKERNNGKIPSDALLAHCARESFHQQWAALLDEELRDAMRHGVCLDCPDGKKRVLLAGIRNNGLCPCHRCLIGKGELSKLGAPTDVERESPRKESEMVALVKEAQQEIFENGYAVDSQKKVENLLKPQSLVPTKNAFSNFSGQSLDIRKALVVDLMHEFEIGAWKRVFIHGIRLLEAFSNLTMTKTAELDWRYRKTPSFGRDTIRKFGVNASDMKRRAARDFEDLLQCAIPAFDSLLPEPHNTIFMQLLYICAQWHALAKLRLHNDFTLEFLEYTTKRLGAQMRYFAQETCQAVPTKELAKEAEARARREGKGKGTAARKAVGFGAFTIKFHFLGDYASTIRWLGTTDSYSTETGELAHKLPKSWYPRTDKKDFEGQMSQIERRQARLAKIRSNNEAVGVATPRTIGPPLEPSPDRRYIIAKNQDAAIDLSSLLYDGSGYQDQYTTGFIPKLKQHLLPRILEKLGYGADSLPPSEYANVVLDGDRIYKHQLLRINYTAYDVRRDEDVIHVATPQCNVMMLNGDYTRATWQTEHPYIYGRCLGVYHANVSFVGLLPDGTRCYAACRIDLVWLHWYKHVPADSQLTLDRLTLMPLEDSGALGFIDPADILRGVHIIPQFALGKAGRQPQTRFAGHQEHWRAFYINRFADRDLFMRYQYGMSVGHTYMHGNFPPPNVPQIPANFDYKEMASSEGLEADAEDAGEETGEQGTLDDTAHIDDMSDQELHFYSDMYGV